MALTLALTGCDGGSGSLSRMGFQNARTFSIGNARDLFANGYEHVTDVYYDNLRISDFALRGLAAVHNVDDHVAIDRVDQTVRVLVDDTVVATFDAPADDDSRAWARVTALALAKARDNSQKARDTEAETLYQVVFDGAIRGTLDPNSRYATPDMARDNRANRDGFGGIGVKLDQHNIRKINTILPDTPASQRGLKSGDVIIAIDGQSTEGMDDRVVISLLRGPIGSELVLTIQREGVDPLPIKIRRAYIVETTVAYHAEPNGIAYFKVTGFNRQTAATLAEQYAHARKDMGTEMRGIVMDLRDNPGGLLDQGVAVSDMFLTAGRILTTRGRHPDSFQKFDASGQDIAKGLPMVVLMNGHSASASEIVAAALQDLGRAVVVGTGSYGKGTVQTVLPMPNGGELTLTWARFYAPSGYALQRLGVFPNICTSGEVVDASKPLDDLRGGRIDFSRTLSARRSADSLSEKSQLALAAACPNAAVDRTNKDIDLDVAERLIGDPQLYRRSLRGLTVASAPTAEAAARN